MAEELSDTNQFNFHSSQKKETDAVSLHALSDTFQAIFHNAPIAIITSDIHLIIRTINPTGEKMLGYSAEEVIGNYSPYQFHDPEELMERYIEYFGKPVSGTADILNLLRETMFFRTSEWTWVKKDGTHFPVKINHTILEDSRGNIQGYLGLVTDISIEKAALEQLKKSEEKFHQFFNNHAAVMFQIDPDNGKIIEFNKAAREFYGYPDNDPVERFITDINCLSPLEVMNEMKLATLQHRNYFNFRHRLLSGETKEVEVQSTPININNKVLLFSIIHDISERKKTEEELLKSKQELENFFTIALDLLSISDGSGYLRKVSRQWEKHFEYTAEELTTRPFLDFVHPDDKQKTIEVMSRLNENRPVTHFVNRYRTKSGDYLYLEWNSVPVGNLIYSAARDITDRVQLQESLEQAIRDEKELNDLKSRFVSMASHEFRTPMTSILMSTETLRSYWNRMSPQQIDSKLANIHAQISHLTSIVNNVLQLAKIQEGKLEPQLELLELVSLCNSVIEAFLADDRLHNRITFESGTSEAWINADPQLIRQVLNNLIANAVKYSQPDPRVIVQLTSENDNIRLSVSDNGIGIPEYDRKKVFQPFFRASNVKNIEGNGLGLNIVKETILLHGGEIEFNSVLKKGTTFIIQLPVVHTDTTAHEQ